jgi:hypothetical protein
MYYLFLTPTSFLKFRSLSAARSHAGGDVSRIFKHVPSIPNPWFVHPIKGSRADVSVVIPAGKLKEHLLHNVFL